MGLLSHRNGFTLAEVLITLGIIGVVAAVTIPTLMNKTQETEAESGLKRIYSDISLAFNQIKADNGGSFTDACANTDANVGFNNLFSEKMKFAKKCSVGDFYSLKAQGCWDSKYSVEGASAVGIATGAILGNGMTVVLNHEYGNCENFSNNPYHFCGFIIVDVNGLKKTNIMGKDQFGMYLYADVIKPWGAKGIPVLWDTIDVITCTESNGYGCAYHYLYE